MLGWFTCLSIALKVGCGIFSDKELQYLNLVILRLVTIFQKKVFNPLIPGGNKKVAYT